MFRALTAISTVNRPVSKCFRVSCHPLSSLSRVPRTSSCWRRQQLSVNKPSVPSFTPCSSAVVRPCHGHTPELTPREKLKKAAKEYGSVLIVFHVGISLVSLGTVYFFISSGVDLQQWIGWLGMSDANENTKIVAGASQFIIAYAIHKSLAPVRISITLVSVPLIVRYLRAKGIMKMKK